MTWLFLAVFACKSPSTDADTDPGDTDVEDTDPPTPDALDMVRIADLQPADVDTVCAELDAVPTVSLDCPPSLDYGEATLPACASTLPMVEGACEATVGDLRDCLADIAMATCESDFSEDPCRSLHAPTCAPLDSLVSAVLGGPYGLQDPMRLQGLTDSQVFAFCLETTDFAPFTLTCGGGEYDIEPGTQEECVARLGATPPGCAATIGDSRSCIEELLAGNCDALFASAGPCAELGAPECVESEPPPPPTP